MYSILIATQRGAIAIPPLSQALESSIGDRPNVRLWGGAYLVQLADLTDWSSLASDLAAVAKANNNFSFLLSPLLSAGDYQGWLPSEVWDTVHGITD